MRQETYQRNYWTRWERHKNWGARRRKARKIQWILEQAMPDITRRAGRGLDIGCSVGVITAHLAGQWNGWWMIGVDIDGEALNLARPYEGLVSFCVGDAMSLPFPDATFDLVICAQVYEHVPDWHQMLREIHRVLRPDGICFFSGPNRLFPIEEHYGLPLLTYLPRPLAHHIVRWSGKGTLYYERPVSWWTLRRTLKAFGFEIEDYTYRLLEDPRRFHLDGWLVQVIAPLVRLLPPRIRPLLTPWMPNFNLVLRKANRKG